MLRAVFQVWLLLPVAGLFFSVILAQQPNSEMPTGIISMGVPSYQPLARQARIEGVVHVKITTDGTKVVIARAQDGHPLLAIAAVENALTWRFHKHTPTSFTMTYRYRIDPGVHPNYPNVRFRFPAEVEVSTTPLKTTTFSSH